MKTLEVRIEYIRALKSYTLTICRANGEIVHSYRNLSKQEMFSMLDGLSKKYWLRIVNLTGN